MKRFIAGARSIKVLFPGVKTKLLSIFKNGYDVLVGDCYGVDYAVQDFFANLNYNNVFVYACDGYARNNKNNWNIISVESNNSKRGFEYYKQKDIVMVNDADYGFMIWDGESKGTLNNIVNLTLQKKTVLLYLNHYDKFVIIKSL